MATSDLSLWGTVSTNEIDTYTKNNKRSNILKISIQKVEKQRITD